MKNIPLLKDVGLLLSYMKNALKLLKVVYFQWKHLNIQDSRNTIN